MHYQYPLKIISFLLLTVGIFHSPVCNNFNPSATSYSEDTLIRDLPAILAKKQLVALVDNSSTSYFIYKGEPMGYEYEMLQSFAKYLKVDLKIVVAKNMNEIFEILNSGQVDILSANLTVTEERMQKVNFTKPLILTRQILIQRKPDGWEKMSREKINEKLVRTTIDLADKNIYVRKGSSFYSRLENLQQEIAAKINIMEVPGDVTTEELIEMVANNKIAYTVADENVAMVNQTYYPQIDINTSISLHQKIAWAVNKKSPLLLAELNNWITTVKGSAEYAILYNKYFKNSKGALQRSESEFTSFSGSRISRYDDMIKAFASEIGWDWRLLASMIYQESKFDPDAESWAGACGLMQLIPSTALLLGIDTSRTTPIESIDAGTRYIKKLDTYWAKHITDKTERTKFVLASYNVGLGHIIDARNLAKKYGSNDQLWTSHVEQYVLLKSKPQFYNDPIVKCGYCRGEEPYKYVREILVRFEHYKNTIREGNTSESFAVKM